MSAFYDLASLVLVPSGYKASKVYAQKPLTTDGQLSFTRASTATRVNSAGLIETVSSNVPRLDYLGSTCPKLLLEPQRTNLFTNSEDFSNASGFFANVAGASTATFTANYAASPDGTQTADRIELALNGGPYADWVRVLGVTVGVTYTYSIYLKSLSGTPTIQFINDGAANIDKTLTTSWARYSFTWTASSATIYPRFLLGSTTSASADILAWGAQLEVGAYATSYIPATTAAVTRLADACSKTGISSLIGQTEGTLFAEVEFNTNSTDLINRIFSVTDGTITSRILICSNTDETFRFIVSVAATTVVNITTSKSVFGGRHKVAFAYKANDFIAYVDGVQVGSNTAVSSLPASLTAAYVGTVEGGASAQILEGTVSQALLFKTRLTNAQLAELTAL